MAYPRRQQHWSRNFRGSKLMEKYLKVGAAIWFFLIVLAQVV